MVALGNEPNFFGREVGELLFEGSLIEVGAFVWPAVEVGYLDLALFVDEDIIGSHVTDLAIDFGEVPRTAA